MNQSYDPKYFLTFGWGLKNCAMWEVFEGSTAYRDNCMQLILPSLLFTGSTDVDLDLDFRALGSTDVDLDLDF